MKQVSRQYFYDETIPSGLIPEAADFLHITDEDYPIYMKENFFSPEICDRLVRDVVARGHQGLVTTVGGNLDQERKTLIMEESPAEQALFYHTLDAEKSNIAHFFGMEITSSEPMNVLGYPVGGEYRAHCDNCAPILKDDELVGFDLNHPRRVLSSILFLTDSVSEITGENQCIGGNIALNMLVDTQGDPLLIEPMKGLFIVFPSNPYYHHQVYPVYEGFRISLVDWHNARLV